MGILYSFWAWPAELNVMAGESLKLNSPIMMTNLSERNKGQSFIHSSIQQVGGVAVSVVVEVTLCALSIESNLLNEAAITERVVAGVFPMHNIHSLGGMQRRIFTYLAGWPLVWAFGKMLRFLILSSIIIGIRSAGTLLDGERFMKCFLFNGLEF